MSYQVTCICGYQFTVPSDSVGKHIACPECHRALIPLPAQPGEAASPAAAAQAPASAAASSGQQTKICPYCGERILAVAKKCRYCGEFVDDSAHPASARTVAPNTPPVFVMSVSQWDNFLKYLICLVIVVGVFLLLFSVSTIHNLISDQAPWIFIATLILMGLIAFIFFVGTRSARCRIWPTRIETQIGFIAKQIDSLEVSRITDIEIKQTILSRILGIGTIIIRTTDVNTPMMELYQIPRARRVFRYLQDQVQKASKAVK